MRKKVEFTTSREIGASPAMVHMDTGLIKLNKDVWDNYDNFEKKFILEHERGHYLMNEDSEVKADQYALHKVYKSAPNSLQRAVGTLQKIGIKNPERHKALTIEALKIDAADNNNKLALKELEKLGISMNRKRTMGDSPFIRREFAAVTGDEDVSTNTNSSGMALLNELLKPKKRGVEIKGYHISFEAIALGLIAVAIFMLSNKK